MTLNPSKQTPSSCTYLFHHSCQCWNYPLNSILPVTKKCSATLYSSLHIVKTFPRAFKFRAKKTDTGANIWSVGRPTHLWYTVFSQKLLLKLNCVYRVQYNNLHIHIARQDKGKLLEHVGSGILLTSLRFNEVIFSSCFPQPLYTVCLDKWYKKLTKKHYIGILLHFNLGFLKKNNKTFPPGTQ